MSNVKDRVDSLVQKVQEDANHAWLNLGKVSKIKTKDVFSSSELGDLPIEDKILHIMRNVEYIPWVTSTLFGFECHPFQSVALRELWTRAFPMFVWSRGASKSTLFGVYAILRALLDQDSKILIIGSSFRQAKGVFDICSGFWYNSSILRSLVDKHNRQGPKFEIDRCTLRLGESIITAIPLGNGEKIRGLRASHLIVDEFKSAPLDVIENVVFGFAAVSKSPLEKVKQKCYNEYLKNNGFWIDGMDEEGSSLSSNQTVVGGTAYWAWNHFADYYKRYKGFIESRGDPERYKRIFGTEMPKNFNHKNFSIIRISADQLPDEFMDKVTLARNKAVMTKANYLVEYGAVFVADSDGFFPRSLIERCVVGKLKEQISYPSCGDVFFRASMKGRYGCTYVIGVDPASQIDNFAIVVLEIWPDHRRVVYSWTSKKSEYESVKRKGLTQEKTFYAFCARKIRSLIKLFNPCVRIVMDSQGGGHQVAEALNDTDKMEPGEKQILPIIDENKEKETDRLVGDHILELVNFSSSEWVSFANHGLKKDLEMQTLLFPFFDIVEIEMAIEMDKESNRVIINPITGDRLSLVDTLEDCVNNIEDLKDEMSIIVQTETPSGREHWDVPVKKSENSSSKIRKDRYSALLMANASARQMVINPGDTYFTPPSVGGAAYTIYKERRVSESIPIGPEWWVKACQGFNGVAVNRGNNN